MPNVQIIFMKSDWENGISPNIRYECVRYSDMNSTENNFPRPESVRKNSFFRLRALIVAKIYNNYFVNKLKH